MSKSLYHNPLSLQRRSDETIANHVRLPESRTQGHRNARRGATGCSEFE